MSVSDRMTATNLIRAKQQIYDICQTGSDIVLVKSVTSDEFGETLTESVQALKAYPVRLSPFSRRVTYQISWSEDVDLICYVSKKKIDDLSLTIAKLKSYKVVRYDNQDYDIKYIEKFSAFANDHLYIVIGGKI